MPNNPFGSQQTSSLPRLVNNGGSISSGGSPVVGPVTPSDSLLVANNAYPAPFTVTGTPKQIDANPATNRISIAVQNQGSNIVEIYPGNANPTFGSGGWQVSPGQWFEFNWTEDVKVYALTAGTSCVISILQNVKR